METTSAPTHVPDRYPWVWGYDLTRQEFDDILAGKLVKWGKLDRDWAAVRIIEWTSYPEMIQRLGYKMLVDGWPRWRNHLRAVDQRRALDFVVDWVAERHPELLNNDKPASILREPALSAAR